MSAITLLRPYCSLSDLQDFLGNDTPDNVNTLLRAINRASRVIEDKTGRNFWFNDYSTSAYRVFRSDVTPKRALLPFEIITLTEVSEDEEVLEEGSDNDYIFDVGTRSIQFTSDRTFPYTGTLLIKGTFGYALADAPNSQTQPPPLLPGEISDAALRIAAAYSGLWEKSVQNPIAGSNETVRVQTPPREAISVLQKYDIRPARAGF